jgi:hypothetical protein
MSRLVDLLQKVNSRNVEFDDAVEFVELTYPMVFGGEVVSREQVANSIASGMGPQIINDILNIIESNPSSYGVEVTHLFSKENILIRTYYADTEEVCNDGDESIS